MTKINVEQDKQIPLKYIGVEYDELEDNFTIHQGEINISKNFWTNYKIIKALKLEIDKQFEEMYEKYEHERRQLTKGYVLTIDKPNENKVRF